MEIGKLYFIKDKFYERFKDCGLLENKEVIDGKEHNRPCCYVLKFNKEDTDIYWMIPISSKLEKYEAEYQKAIKKYGKENFEWEIIDKCQTLESATELESMYIIKYNSCISFKNSNGYNIILWQERFKIAPNSIKVLAYDKNGNYVNTYLSYGCAARELNCQYENIIKCLKGERRGTVIACLERVDPRLGVFFNIAVGGRVRHSKGLYFGRMQSCRVDFFHCLCNIFLRFVRAFPRKRVRNDERHFKRTC